MRILVIGGGVFVGPAFIEAAHAAGHHVTAFARGSRGAPPDGVAWVRGDRSVPEDLAQLSGQAYDAVLDTCGYVPRDVLASARLLEPNVGRYVFVSSISAYSDLAGGVDESGRVFECPPDAGPDDGEYGELKAGCERAVEEVFAERGVSVRAGLIVGPRDNVGRLPWWLGRIARGGEVLAPGRSGRPAQWVDVRDLGAFMLGLCAPAALSGPVNVTSPPGWTTAGEILGECIDATGSDATLTWVAEEFLAEQGVIPWEEMPLWAPEEDADWAGFYDVDVSLAAAHGLQLRPPAHSVRDTWAWLAAGGTPLRRAGVDEPGIDPEKEARVLAEWHARPENDPPSATSPPP